MSKQNIVIIGTGLAGSLLANRLSDTAGVVALEIGPAKGVEFPSIRFAGKPLAEVDTFCMGEGGTTNLWHNGLIPLDPLDISAGTFKEVLVDAEEFMDPAAAALFFPEGSFSYEYRTARARMNQLGSELGLGGASLDCLIYPNSYRPLKICPPGRARFLVRDLGFEGKGRRIEAVTFSQGGVRHTAPADVVIVAAGAMGTPDVVRRMLETVGADTSLPGTGFMDHPMGFVGKVRFKQEYNKIMKEISLSQRGEYETQGILRIRSECGRFTCGIFFRPALTMENRLGLYKFKSSLGATRGSRRLRNALSMKLLHPDIVAEVVAHLSGARIPSRTYGVLLVAEQRRGGNRVYHDREGLVVDWRVSEEELSGYRSVLCQLRGLLEDAAEEMVIQEDLSDSWLWSCAHHSGTMPMGEGEEDLLDRDLRLKPFENVFVCDGSVIQEHSYANTGLTIGQLALRLAERIREGDPAG